jgi:hypothetical protein
MHQAPHVAGGRQRLSSEQSVGNVQKTEKGEAVMMQRPRVLPRERGGAKINTKLNRKNKWEERNREKMNGKYRLYDKSTK